MTCHGVRGLLVALKGEQPTLGPCNARIAKSLLQIPAGPCFVPRVVQVCHHPLSSNQLSSKSPPFRLLWVAALGVAREVLRNGDTQRLGRGRY